VLSVTTTMPGWRAPGAPIVIRGFSGAHVRLTLWRTVSVAAAVRVRGRYEPLRRCAWAATGSSSGAPAAASRSDADRRPLVIDAVGDIAFGDRSARQSPSWSSRTVDLRRERRAPPTSRSGTSRRP
jgi:hypothetical protein